MRREPFKSQGVAAVPRGRSALVVRHAQQHLIKKVWPDKILYGSIMLLVTALLGVLHAAAVATFDISYGPRVPGYLHPWPAELVLVLSVVAAVLAFVALKKISTLWGMIGAAAGALSMGLLGAGTVLSLVALGFLVWARMEGEDDIPEAERLDPEEWPDKSLGASLVLLLAGLASAGWGYGVLSGGITFAGNGLAFGSFQVLAGLVALAAAYALYHQRAKWLGVAAAVLSILAFAVYVVGPLLGAIALGLTLKASREGEFER